MTRDEAMALLEELRVAFGQGAFDEAGLLTWLTGCDLDAGRTAVVDAIGMLSAIPTADDLTALLAERKDMHRLADEAWAELQRVVRMAHVRYHEAGTLGSLQDDPIGRRFTVAWQAFADRTQRNLRLGPWDQQARIADERLVALGFSSNISARWRS